MEALVKLLRQKKMTIASIESLTAGMFASHIADIPHASSVLKGALVTYQTACKEDVLKVSKSIIDTYGVISVECAEAMAKCGAKMFQTDIVVSFSGNAGPDVMEDKPAGFVCMAIWIKGCCEVYEMQFSGERNEVRKASCEFIKEELMKKIQCF